VNVNAADYDRRTCLHLAASVGNLSIVQLLLEKQADINFTDRWGGTALYDAVREGHRRVADVLRSAGGQLKFDEGKASGELSEMARTGDVEGMKTLLTAGCSANAADYDKRTCLHLAASTGQGLVVRYLISRGDVKINFQDRWGGTPLYDAVREGHNECARLLVEAKAQLMLNEERAVSELCDAARKGNVMMIKQLMAGGIDPNAKDYDNRSCLMLASATGNIHAAKLLVEGGVDINAKDRYGGNALGDALREGHTHVVRLLLAKGATLSMDKLEAAGKLCDLAAEGNIDQLEQLLDCGLDSMTSDYDGRTPLHLAAANGHLHIVKHLIGRGADVNFTDRFGGMPVDDAMRGNMPHVVAFLKEAMEVSKLNPSSGSAASPSRPPARPPAPATGIPAMPSTTPGGIQEQSQQQASTEATVVRAPAALDPAAPSNQEV